MAVLIADQLSAVAGNRLTPAYRYLLERLDAYELGDPAHSFGFVRRLMRQQGWTHAVALRAIREYKKFIFLAMVADHQAVPSGQIDQVWHLHLLMTESYWEEFCPNVLGRKLHPRPSTDGSEERGAKKHQHLYRRTMGDYRAFFGEPPPDVWPPAHSRFRPVGRTLRGLFGRWRTVGAAGFKGVDVLRPQGLVWFSAAGLIVAAAQLARVEASTAGLAPPAGLPSISPVALVLYGFLLPLAIGWLLIQVLHLPRRQGAIPPLDPYQLAYLDGGRCGLMLAVLAELVGKGLLTVHEQKGTLARVRSPVPAGLSPLQQLVLNRLRENARLQELYRYFSDGDSTPSGATWHPGIQEVCEELQRLKLVVGDKPPGVIIIKTLFARLWLMFCFWMILPFPLFLTLALGSVNQVFLSSFSLSVGFSPSFF